MNEKQRRELRQQNQLTDAERRDILSSLVLTSGVGAAVPAVLNDKVMPNYNASAEEKKKLEELLESMSDPNHEPLVFPGTKRTNRILTTNRGDGIVVQSGEGYPRVFDEAGNIGIIPNDRMGLYVPIGDKERNLRGQIMLGSKQDRTTFLHELGHATGLGKRDKYLKTVARLGNLSKKSRKGRVLGSGLVSILNPPDDNQEETAQRIADANLAINLGVESPLLFEEARANLRARGLAKKFGVDDLNTRQLARGYGTYLTAAGVSLAPALIGRHLVKRRMKKRKERREQEKKAQLYVLSPELLGKHYLEKEAMIPNMNLAKNFLQSVATKATNIAKDPSQLAALGHKLQSTAANATMSTMATNPALSAAMSSGSFSQLGLGLAAQGGAKALGSVVPKLGGNSMFNAGRTLLGGLV